jgi:NADH-quinone oxidoreductase subunit I
VDACPKDAIRMDTYTHTPAEYNRQGFVYDIPKLLKGPAVSHPSDPWNKRPSSAQPEHGHKEAHTRIGEHEAHHPAQLEAGHGHAEHATPGTSRTVVSNEGPVPVTKFLK